MTSFNGYIQGITSGEKRIVEKQGKMVTVSAFDNIDDVIVFNEAGETSQKTLTGKNLLSYNVTTQTVAGVDFDFYEDGSIHIHGTTTASNCFLNLNYISSSDKAIPSGSYKFNIAGASVARLQIIASGSVVATSSGSSFTSVTIPNDATSSWARILVSWSVGTTIDETVYPMICKSTETDTSYEPYCGGIPSPNPDYPQDIKGIGLKQSDGTYSVFLDYDADEERFGRITASGLAYPLYEGDILDFVNGKVIRAKACLDLSTINWANNQSYANVFNGTLTEALKAKITTDILCNRYKYETSSTVTTNDFGIAVSSNRYYLYVHDSNFTQATDFKTWLQNNKTLAVYSLETPVEEPITITGDITDIGTAVVTAEGTLTIKYDKAKMAIRKYRNPPEWNDIGYDSTPAEIITAFDYAKNLQDSWTGVRNFYGVKDLYYFPDVNMKESRSYNGMFQNTNLMHVPPIVFGEETITGNANADGMFRSTFVEDVSLTSANSTQKFSMNSTFYECFLLKSVTLNLKAYGNLNTMFYNCKKLTSVSGDFDTSEVTELKETFRGCNSLRIVPSWDTSSCTSFWRTFTDCTSLTTAPNWNLRNATDLSQMFWGCTALKHVPTYYIPNATNLNGMFQGIGSNLDEGSQNDILLMCANASSYTGTKTLAQLGFNASMYPASSWQGLSKYADFVDAGWTIGYS